MKTFYLLEEFHSGYQETYTFHASLKAKTLKSDHRLLLRQAAGRS